MNHAISFDPLYSLHVAERREARIRGRLVAQAKLQWQAGDENYEATRREADEAQALCVEALCKGDSLGSVAQQRIRDGLDFDETMRAYTAACRLKWKAEQLGHRSA